ncbi:redox-sensitive transcriptional activator SoxR [Leptospira brenneri]|uniref:Redox-sensitive transcriptional activator SoxR n=1 Tax=Leptospira brenneri TaxID=2023182 RepID=A0A2M9Y4A9_9LEPT|nr:redox-sensitive transcriptional activator SoxR [Leptospira brenneri]PJZ46420.1 redox-sensitive transcriptional activator SoxR [Leptospira brenneri]TGK96523.1 redox-sensitive transcriptional activator SoxR [Leptospira brenneri]
MENLLSISQVAKRSGVKASALRYYEERGLITSIRTSSGKRHYMREILRRIAFIVFAQKIGLSLEEIGAEIEKLPHGHTPKGQDWSKLSKTWTERLDQKIEELLRLKSGLTHCIGCGCLSLSECRLVNPNDKLANYGSGPRRWLRKEKSITKHS